MDNFNGDSDLDETEFVDGNKVCFYQSVIESINKDCDISTAEIDNICLVGILF